MLAAAFETSTRSPSVALRSEGAVLEELLSGARPHASDLLPALERLLARVGRSARDLDCLVVGTGPGSFTGLRVAAATALGLSRGGRAELVGLPSGEALAWRELAPGEEAAICSDARQGEWYFARYRRSAADVLVLSAPCAVATSALPALLAGAGRIFADSPAAALELLDAATRARMELGRIPTAAAALELGLLRRARDGSEVRSIEPLYLRAFGARARAPASD